MKGAKYAHQITEAHHRILSLFLTFLGSQKIILSLPFALLTASEKRDTQKRDTPHPGREASAVPSYSLLNQALQAKHTFHHMAVHIGEAVVPALEAVGEFLMVESEQMHPCGLQVVDVDLVTDDVESELVRFTMDVATPSPPPPAIIMV